MATHNQVANSKKRAHLAHEVHLAAEGLEFLDHAGKAAIEAARTILKTGDQMARDLRRMNGAIGGITRSIRNGGGAQAAAKLAEANKAIQAAKAAIVAEQPTIKAANELLRELKAVQKLRGAHHTSGVAWNSRVAKLGRLVLRFQKVLEGSRVGRLLLKTGKVVASKAVVRALIVVGAALEAHHSYVDSPNQTTGGKVANAALGGAGGALVMANPVVAAADLVAPEGYKLSEVYHGTAASVSAIGEGVVTGDTRGMETFHSRSMKGHYGRVLQEASMAGEFWSAVFVGQ